MEEIIIQERKKIILVNSHRRSGTHFLIDSLRKNISNAYFPNHFAIPADFNVGSLFAKSNKITQTFVELINKNENPVIIKSHLLPEEMNIEKPRDLHESFIKSIYDRAFKLYVYRDGKDVLSSLYNYLDPKHKNSFSQFLRQPNDHIVEKIRQPSAFDQNRVCYWDYHLNSWKKTPNTHIVSYSELKANFQNTMESILRFLDIDNVSNKKILPPQIPKNKLFHGIQKRLNHFGLAHLPESSSVKPRKGTEGDSKNYFTPTDLIYFNENITNK